MASYDIRSDVRQIVDPLFLKLREELMGSGVSFGNLQQGILPTSVIVLTGGGDPRGGGTNIDTLGYIKGITTLSGTVTIGTVQTELSFIGANVTAAGERTTITITQDTLLSGLRAPRQISWYEDGVLTVGTSKGPLRRIDVNCTCSGSYVYTKVAPTGAAIIVNILRSTAGPNGTYTTIFSSKPQIAASSDNGSSSAFSTTLLNAGDYLRMDIDQVGSTLAGSSLTVDLNIVTR